MEDKSVIATIGREKYTTIVQTNSHRVVIDEPSTKGGKDIGPAPEELISISLASCTAITLRMYADHKKFDVSEIKVKVSSMALDGKTSLDCSIEVIGDITDVQRKRFLHIAKLCPVHRLLTNPIEIETRLTRKIADLKV